jgi:membrane protease subunit (stomatin/prohibitin family)
MGETIDSLINLPQKYDSLSENLVKRLKEDFSHFGLGLTHLYINSITPPPEVQQAIDDRSRMGVFQDMNKLMQMKAAMAMEKAAEAGDAGGAGIGMSAGLGLMLPAMFAQYFTGQKASGQQTGMETFACSECENPIPQNSRFCPFCGHQQLILEQCSKCGKNLTPNARFCSRCGHPTDEKPKPWLCSKCGSENLAEAIFCNQCGEKH